VYSNLHNTNYSFKILDHNNKGSMSRHVPEVLTLDAPSPSDYRGKLAPESIEERIAHLEGLSAEQLMARLAPSGSLSGNDPAGFTILRHSAKLGGRVNDESDYNLLRGEATVDTAYALGVAFAKNLYLSSADNSEPMPILSTYSLNNCRNVTKLIDRSRLRSTEVLTGAYKLRYPEVYDAVQLFVESIQGKFGYGMTFPDDIVRGFHDYFCVITMLHSLPEADLVSDATTAAEPMHRGLGSLGVHRAS
jgi:hypothetical protein